jgi:hypothetical protein
MREGEKGKTHKCQFRYQTDRRDRIVAETADAFWTSALGQFSRVKEIFLSIMRS